MSLAIHNFALYLNAWLAFCLNVMFFLQIPVPALLLVSTFSFLPQVENVEDAYLVIDNRGKRRSTSALFYVCDNVSSSQCLCIILFGHYCDLKNLVQILKWQLFLKSRCVYAVCTLNILCISVIACNFNGKIKKILLCLKTSSKWNNIALADSVNVVYCC